MTSNRVQQLREFLKQDPDDEFTNFALALEYLKTDQLQEALELFLKLKNHNPEYVGVYYHLGKLYEKLNRFDDAVQTYQNGIGIATRLREHHTSNELQQALQELQLDDE